MLFKNATTPCSSTLNPFAFCGNNTARVLSEPRNMGSLLLGRLRSSRGRASSLDLLGPREVICCWSRIVLTSYWLIYEGRRLKLYNYVEELENLAHQSGPSLSLYPYCRYWLRFAIILESVKILLSLWYWLVVWLLLYLNWCELAWYCLAIIVIIIQF